MEKQVLQLKDCETRYSELSTRKCFEYNIFAIQYYLVNPCLITHIILCSSRRIQIFILTKC